MAREDTKFGLSELELRALVTELDQFPNVEVVGLMGMATNTKDSNVINDEFNFLKNLYDELGSTRNWHTLSMGMSEIIKLPLKMGQPM